MKTLQETVSNMLSSDWKDRLVAEIEQADIRLFHLDKHMKKIGSNSPEYSLLEAQKEAMETYLSTLCARASSFGIDYKLPTGDFATEKIGQLDPLFSVIVLYMTNTFDD